MTALAAGISFLLSVPDVAPLGVCAEMAWLAPLLSDASDRQAEPTRRMVRTKMEAVVGGHPSAILVNELKKANVPRQRAAKSLVGVQGLGSSDNALWMEVPGSDADTTERSTTMRR